MPYDATVSTCFPQLVPTTGALSLLLLVGVLVGGCGSQSAPPDAAPDSARGSAVQVEVLALERTSFEDVISVTGDVEALNDASLSAQTNGTVTMIKERGAQVDEGEAVATVDADEARAAVEQARAQYELAQDRFERQQPLYRDSIISPLEFEQVRSQRNQARAALQQAEKRLANTRVEAPFPGIVEERFIEAGEQAAPGTQVARVVNTRRVRVTAGVPERYANDIRRGTPVRLDVGRYDAGVRSAQVTFVGNTIDPESRTFPIEVTVPNEDRTLKPSMGVQLRVTRAVLDSVLVLPRTAVLRDETGPHVYVAEQTDSTVVARNRDLVLGPATGPRVVADSGLAAGDRVIVAGQTTVSPGDRLRITDRYDRVSAAGAPYKSNADARPTASN